MSFNNMTYWAHKIPHMAESIRRKMEESGCPYEIGSFPFFGFIDNTMNATCRPAGGQSRDGRNAPRNDPRFSALGIMDGKKFMG